MESKNSVGSGQHTGFRNLLSALIPLNFDLATLLAK